MGQNQSSNWHKSQIQNKMNTQKQSSNISASLAFQFMIPLQANPFCPTKKAYQRLIQLLKQNEPALKDELKIPLNFQKGAVDKEYQYFLIKIFNVVYRGQCKNKLPHGSGNIYFSDGALFRGFFQQGIPYGEDNLFIFKDGSYYRGQIKNNCFNGNGKFHSDYVTYTGKWKDGLPHGKGSQIFSNQNLYEGNFVQGYKEGQKQLLKWNDHQFIFHKYQGGFEGGWFKGPFKITLYDGKVLQGRFNQQKIQKLVFQGENQTFKGQLDHQLINGKGKWINNKSQTQYEGQIRNGQLEGKGFIRQKNKKQKQVYWLNGIQLKSENSYHNSHQIQQILNQSKLHFAKLNKYSQIIKNLRASFPKYKFLYSESTPQQQYKDSFRFNIGRKVLNIAKAV